MRQHARKAFNELKKIGVPVFDRQESRNQHFIISAELADSESEYWADMYHENVREQVTDDGEIINAFGIRQEIHDIIDRHGLMTEWVNGAMIGVYEGW